VFIFRVGVNADFSIYMSLWMQTHHPACVVALLFTWCVLAALFFLCWYHTGISLSSDDFCSDSALVLGLIPLEFFNVLMFCLNSRRWFMLFLACIPYLVSVQVSGDRD
jgi:hypothetical protein